MRGDGQWVRGKAELGDVRYVGRLQRVQGCGWFVRPPLGAPQDSAYFPEWAFFRLQFG